MTGYVQHQRAHDHLEAALPRPGYSAPLALRRPARGERERPGGHAQRVLQLPHERGALLRGHGPDAAEHLLRHGLLPRVRALRRRVDRPLARDRRPGARRRSARAFLRGVRGRRGLGRAADRRHGRDRLGLVGCRDLDPELHQAHRRGRQRGPAVGLPRLQEGEGLPQRRPEALRASHARRGAGGLRLRSALLRRGRGRRADPARHPRPAPARHARGGGDRLRRRPGLQRRGELRGHLPRGPAPRIRLPAASRLPFRRLRADRLVRLGRGEAPRHGAREARLPGRRGAVLRVPGRRRGRPGPAAHGAVRRRVGARGPVALGRPRPPRLGSLRRAEEGRRAQPAALPVRQRLAAGRLPRGLGRSRTSWGRAAATPAREPPGGLPRGHLRDRSGRRVGRPALRELRRRARAARPSTSPTTPSCACGWTTARTAAERT